MSEDEDPSSDADFENMMEAIQKEREERQEQVSFKWIEKVRKTGELWRSVEDAKIVAEETELSLETTREALTIYRLVFEDPSNVAMKASKVARMYFSLEQELDEEFDNRYEDEPVADLLREYVGALYLDHDIEELPLGDPPREETPPRPVDWEELSETFSQSISVSKSTIVAFANVVNSDLLRTEKMVADAIQPVIDHRQRMIANMVKPLIEHRQKVLAQSLAPLTTALEQQQNMIAQSTAMIMSEAIQDINFPDSVLADLAVFQPSVSAAAASAHSLQDERSVYEAAPATAEVKILETTAETVPETGVANATVNSTLPSAGTFTTELIVEVPAMIVKSMLSTGRARIWFSNLPDDHQLTAVRLLLASVAVYVTGNPFVAPIAIIPAPSVRRAIVVEN
jgi:hypothetical protein